MSHRSAKVSWRPAYDGGHPLHYVLWQVHQCTLSISVSVIADDIVFHYKTNNKLLPNCSQSAQFENIYQSHSIKLDWCILLGIYRSIGRISAISAPVRFDQSSDTAESVLDPCWLYLRFRSDSRTIGWLSVCTTCQRYVISLVLHRRISPRRAPSLHNQ